VRRFLDWGSWCFLTLSILLSAVGAFSFPLVERANDPERSVRVDGKTLSIGEVQTGSKRAVLIALHNQTSRPVRILGPSGYCSRYGCVDVRDVPFTVPSHSSRRVVIDVTTGIPGRFVQTVNLYTDCPAAPELRITITGDVLEKKRS
jgi:hypothetical protein